jgi:hypothetical protein
MARLQTRRHTRTWIPARIHDVLAVVVFGMIEECLDARLSEAPGTGVERLLLAPDDGLGVGVHVEVLFQRFPGKGVELLDADDGCVLDALVGAVLVESGVDLACAEDDTLDFVGFGNAVAVLGVGDNPLELGLAGEFLDIRAGNGVTEQGLGEEDDES